MVLLLLLLLLVAVDGQLRQQLVADGADDARVVVQFQLGPGQRAVDFARSGEEVNKTASARAPRGLRAARGGAGSSAPVVYREQTQNKQT